MPGAGRGPVGAPPARQKTVHGAGSRARHRGATPEAVHGAAEAAPGPGAFGVLVLAHAPEAGGSVVATMLPALSLTLHKT